MRLAALLTLVLIAVGAVERALHEKNLRRAPVRVLVNGTRGKTSVTRLLAAALREAGHVTFAKCTGTAAVWILPDGTEKPLRRRRGARLTEQLPFFRRAARSGARAAVVECMAIRPESQRAMAQLVRPTMVLITNARVDHVDELGKTERDTLWALAQSIPEGATVVSAEAGLRALGFSPVDPSDEPVDEAYLSGFGYPMFEDNVRLVLAACALLGIDRATALAGMRRAAPDPGQAGPFRIGECVVVNAFAANDTQSSAALLEQIERARGLEGAPIGIVFNNRADREYRLRAFLPLVCALSGRVFRLIAIGENAGKVARYYGRRACVPASAGEPEELLGMPGIVLCLGNIKGAGLDFIERCRAQGEV
ncbi:poly-gamma-glutamate synthase PgsB [Bacillota bacterium Meth-B3]